jgi:hypothetical protein
MSDYIIVDGDTANFLPTFGAAIVVVAPGTITGSAADKVFSKNACVEGDEASVEVPGCMYMAGPFSIPGSGTLKIDALASDQKAEKTNFGAVPAILKGGQFDAVFEVQAPAAMPPPVGTPDSMTKYSGGKGSFVNSNATVKAG